MTSPARREPLLWLQLLGLAALPLEAAALLLVLAGADPGPLAGLERLFCWALGGLGPAVLFWKLPPDLWSLLLVQVPLRGRRPDQLRLSALQNNLSLKGLCASGVLLTLPLLWWADTNAGLAWAWSPLAGSPRLLVLLMAASLLTLLLWQWQQIVQALWMLSRSAANVAQTLPLSQEEAGERRLNLGLPLLLLAPLEAGQAAPVHPPQPSAPAAATESTPASETDSDIEIHSEPAEAEAPAAAETEAETTDATEPPAGDPSVEAGAVSDAAAITPEQGAKEAEGAELDQQI